MNPTPFQVTDLAKAQIIASQSEWLDSPVTRMFLNALTARQDEYQRNLIKRCLIVTDVNADIQDRACISTCKAIQKILTDPELFVRYSTLKTV